MLSDHFRNILTKKSEHHDIPTRKFQHTACASSDLHKNGTKILNLEEMSDPCRRISE